MTDDTPSVRLLRAIFDEPIPCGHIERFIAFYVDSPVTLMNDTGDDSPAIGCAMCEVALTFEQFDALGAEGGKRRVRGDCERRVAGEELMVTFPEGTTPIQELYSHLNGYCGEYEDLGSCLHRIRELIEELMPEKEPERGVEFKEG
jgi:hypothetical protein